MLDVCVKKIYNNKKIIKSADRILEHLLSDSPETCRLTQNGRYIFFLSNISRSTT